jgi:hypothetical protein
MMHFSGWFHLLVLLPWAGFLAWNAGRPAFQCPVPPGSKMALIDKGLIACPIHRTGFAGRFVSDSFMLLGVREAINRKNDNQ